MGIEESGAISMERKYQKTSKMLGAMTGTQSRSSMKESIPSEHMEQVALLRWWGDNINHLIFAIPNGEKRAMSVAKRLKEEGVTNGIPDLFCPAFSLWIEMKRVKGGVISDDQKYVIAYLESIGHTVIVGYGANDAIKQLLNKLSLQ